jgi:hypothetical protein
MTHDSGNQYALEFIARKESAMRRHLAALRRPLHTINKLRLHYKDYSALHLPLYILKIVKVACWYASIKRVRKARNILVDLRDAAQMLHEHDVAQVANFFEQTVPSSSLSRELLCAAAGMMLDTDNPSFA